MISVSKSVWTGGKGIRNGRLVSCQIPGFDTLDNSGTWGTPDGVMFDIPKEKLTDEMTIHIKYLEKDITFKVKQMKGVE